MSNGNYHNEYRHNVVAAVLSRAQLCIFGDRPVGREKDALEGRVGGAPQRVLQIVAGSVVAPAHARYLRLVMRSKAVSFNTLSTLPTATVCGSPVSHKCKPPMAYNRGQRGDKCIC